MTAPQDASKGNSKLKTAFLISTTLIAFASLAFNVVQYQSNQELREFETRSMYPSVNTFRLKLSATDIETVHLLAQNGAEFSYIANPSFLLYDKLSSIDDDSATVEFLIIANDSDVALSGLGLSQADPNVSQLTVSHLASHSTLLIPEKIYRPGQVVELLTKVTIVSYDFSLGGNKFSESLSIPPPSSEVIVFEVGLGAIPKASFDFDDN